MLGFLSTCTACKKEFTALTTHESLCPDCNEDQALYLAVRRKAEPRQFLPYKTLLEAWKSRRAECRDARKLVALANAAIAKAKVIERENEALRIAVTSSTEALAAEVAYLRVETTQQREFIKTLREQIIIKVRRDFLNTGSPAIPADKLKQLISLCHPDRWYGKPQERVATEVMKWLNADHAR